MKHVFADTSFFIALLSPVDEAHAQATLLAGRRDRILITTGFVIAELGNALCRPEDRPLLLPTVQSLREDASCLIIPPSSQLLMRGLEYFSRRSDKLWSLTDCTSFVVMHDHEITDALTTDHHFEQAGFQILLKPT